MKLKSLLGALPLALCLGAGVAQAEKLSLCVYDVGGANGDVFNMMKDFRTEAVAWGVELDLKPYTDEATASQDFKAGQCKAVLMTGTRVRAFHKLAGTVEAMGALPTYKNLKTVVKNLSNKRAAKLMKRKTYEVGGIYPGGAVYLLVRDRNINSVPKLAGKSIATLSFDTAAKVMVGLVGASMASADVGTFAGMFNNGSVDACYAPAVAYKALELYKGVGKKGGVLRYPLAQMTLQLLFRSADFPDGFGQHARDYAVQHFDSALKAVKDAEKEIPKSAWIEIPQADKDKYDEMFLDVRLRLRDKEKVFHKTTLKLMRRVRCKANPARAECAEKRE